MDDKLKTFEEFYDRTEGEAIDDYAESLDSNLESDLTTAINSLIGKYDHDAVIDAINRLYK